MPAVYSYKRFSSKKQSTGTSIARQAAAARDYADRHNLTLDTTLDLTDEGLSAYHERHIKDGALGAFIEAIHLGRVVPGSLLIVESLDRLSRAGIYRAQRQFGEILEAGVDVVTLADGKHYTKSSLNDLGDMITSIVIMARAHEESDIKSKRATAAKSEDAQKFIDNGRGIIKGGKNPPWVELNANHDGFEIVPHHADTAREAIRLFCMGNGFVAVCRLLKEQGRKPFNGDFFSPSTMSNWLKSDILIGHKKATIKGEQVQLQNYYPALISPAQLAAARKEAGTRQKVEKQSTSGQVNIFTGLGILTCGCGATLVSQNGRKNGKWYRRIRCNGKECNVTLSSSVLEDAILRFCRDRMQLAEVLNVEIPADDTSLIEARLAEIGPMLERLVDDYLAGNMPDVLKSRMHQLEAEQTELTERLQVARDAQLVPSVDLLNEWNDIAAQCATGDDETRLAIRQLVRNTFKAINVERLKRQNYKIRLTFITGESRVIIDRSPQYKPKHKALGGRYLVIKE